MLVCPCSTLDQKLMQESKIRFMDQSGDEPGQARVSLPCLETTLRAPQLSRTYRSTKLKYHIFSHIVIFLTFKNRVQLKVEKT